MEVASLFANLGIKGTDKSVGALTGVKKGMSEVKSEGLAAKAAMVGVIYALERMFEVSSRRGAQYTNFAAMTGISTKTLQQYQWAAQQVNVANSEVEASFKGLQSAMAATLMGQGAPAGLARVADVLKMNFTTADIERFAQSPQQLLQVLQKYAAAEKNDGYRNQVLRSFGVSDGMISALARHAFTPDVMSKAPTLSDGQIKSLDKVQRDLSNVKQKVAMAFESFTAKHGDQLVHDIDVVTTSVVKLTEALITLGDKLHIFDALGSVVNWLAGEMNQTSKDAGATQAEAKGKNWWDRITDSKAYGQQDQQLDADFKRLGVNPAAMLQSALNFLLSAKGAHAMDAPRVAAPGVSSGTHAALQKSGGKVEFNQSLHFQHPGENAKETGDSTHAAVQKAYRQISAQGQST